MAKAKPDQDLRALLWQGLRTNNTELVRQALAAGAGPNCGYGDWRPLGKALRHDMPEIALLLVEAGADLAFREYERSMLTLAAGSSRYLDVLRAMLARTDGDFHALEMAARSGNAPGVAMLLETGVGAIPAPPVQDGPRQWPEPIPVLAHWPWKREAPPAALVEATYSQPLPDRAAQQLGLAFAHQRNLAGLQQLAGLGRISALGRQQVLYQCLQSCWLEGTQWLLEQRFAPGGIHAGPGPGMLTALSSWLNDPKRRSQGWRILSELVAQGHHPDLRLWDPADNGETGDPQGIVLLGRVAASVRRSLLKHLLALGMRPAYARGSATSTLAHALVALGDVDLLPMLDKHFPGLAWETADTHSLIGTWIAHHGLVRHDIDTEPGQAMLHGLARCGVVAGVDWSRRDNGQSLFRSLLEANQAGWAIYENKKTALLETIAMRFIEHGVDVLVPDEHGICDIQFAQQMNLAASIVARLQTAALERRTASVAAGRRGPRL